MRGRVDLKELLEAKGGEKAVWEQNYLDRCLALFWGAAGRALKKLSQRQNQELRRLFPNGSPDSTLSAL